MCCSQARAGAESEEATYSANAGVRLSRVPASGSKEAKSRCAANEHEWIDILGRYSTGYTGSPGWLFSKAFPIERRIREKNGATNEHQTALLVAATQLFHYVIVANVLAKHKRHIGYERTRLKTLSLFVGSPGAFFG
jgi:hypothetical protein